MSVVIVPEVLGRVARLPATRLEGAGATVRELVEDVCTRHAALREHLFYGNDQFKEHFLLTAGGELLEADSPLPADAELDILLATSGGLDCDELSNDEVRRYVRHITLPDVGRQGQLRLKQARVLIIGTGGLGSPVSLYLAAAGIGTLGLVDFDRVESSNLQRQVVHGSATLGMAKVESARRRLLDHNPAIRIDAHDCAMTADNALQLVSNYDLVIDGTDNFTTRYLLNRSSFELRWGFQREIIPLHLVEWAHPVSDFDSPMPLPGFLLPWQYYGKRNIRGLGAVEFAATDKQNMVLIRADKRHFVISPVDAHAFAQDFENVSMLGAAEPIEPVSQNLPSMLRDIFQDATAKKLLIAGLLGVLLLTAVTFTLSATRLTVTWTTLEQVPSSRLLLLSLVGALDWLLNTFLGSYFFLRGLLEKRWIYLIWGWSVLISLILTLAAIFMSLGNA